MLLTHERKSALCDNGIAVGRHVEAALILARDELVVAQSDVYGARLLLEGKKPMPKLGKA